MIDVDNITIQNNEVTLSLIHTICSSKELKTYTQFFPTYPHLHKIRQYKKRKSTDNATQNTFTSPLTDGTKPALTRLQYPMQMNGNFTLQSGP